MRVLLCIRSGSVLTQIQTPPTQYTCIWSDLNRHEHVQSYIRNYFFTLCGGPCLSLVQLIRMETWVEFSKKMTRERRFLDLKACLFFFFFSSKFALSSDFWDVVSGLVAGVYWVWSDAAASFCRNSLVCPASDEVSTSKSGFQKASPRPPPLFYSSPFTCWGRGVFLSLLGTETCGVHSVVFAGGKARRQRCQREAFVAGGATSLLFFSRLKVSEKVISF